MCIRDSITGDGTYGTGRPARRGGQRASPHPERREEEPEYDSNGQVIVKPENNTWETIGVAGATMITPKN